MVLLVAPNPTEHRIIAEVDQALVVDWSIYLEQMVMHKIQLQEETNERCWMVCIIVTGNEKGRLWVKYNSYYWQIKSDFKF